MLRVLGDIAVDGGAVTRRREREVLGLLVAARGRAVAVERLLDEVGTTDAGRPAVQVAVSRLRALLDPGRTGRCEVRSGPAGYALVVEAGEVDAWTFEDLAEQALAVPTPTDRLVLGTRAAERWVGEAYAECQAPSLRAEAGRLAELQVTVQECRADALLSLGHPATAVRLLTRLAPEHPYREQLWALLARAQYACSRQADALATLATLRTRLAEDLGVDPSPLVRSMEHAVLTQDAGLSSGVPRTGSARHPARRRTRRCRAASVTAGRHRATGRAQ